MLLVVKAGGRALEQNMERILDSIAWAVQEGHKVVFVHGGGDLVTEYSKKMGVEPKIMMSASGVRFRYTDEEELEVFVMVLAGLLNKRIVAGLEKRGVKALGVSGVDAGMIRAERKKHVIVIDPETGRKRLLPGGYTGKIRSVDANAMTRLLDAGFTLVVAPLALGTEGEMLNVDGDQAAAEIAKALRADKLILLTDVDGLLIDGKLVESLTPDEARALLEKIGPGMNRKVMMAVEALEAGVGEVVIGSGLRENPIRELLEGAPATRLARG
ncbi:acetylglutamate kinase [Pyrolobus fumarii 1A]|uniref:Putative [LysW]-aminoadipate/[LysW]-glutamate kinase n=1 Tax=Pyrolobus fumarii (strain DSM 11204 / 1A) TaxID=694429 RepID=G0EFT7_PYRF1|nr:[LysW]-aminoadipate/[LysW]-glutamate kinase [Pyrolobus fumarii]AEM38258.1 acetylglutamate kinase [Pyrolobus fumarii 1A]